MTTYKLFYYALIVHIQHHTMQGETDKDVIRELFDQPHVIYSDKAAKQVIANLDPSYVEQEDRAALSDFAFGDRIHITPKYTDKGLSITFVPPTNDVLGMVLHICPKETPFTHFFTKHRFDFLRNNGILGRNSLLWTTP